MAYRASLLACGLFICVCSVASAQAPLSLEAVGSPAAFIAEATEKADEIHKILESAETYKDGAAGLKQSASLVAVLGQALAEHPEDSSLKKAGPSIRAAAITLARAASYEEAQAAWPKLAAALKGEVSADVPAEFNWAKLSRMHPMMEEMNGRAAKFRRVIRRPKDPEVDSRHVMAIALGAIATHADTHEVKNPADLPQWHAWAAELHDHMAKSAAAVRAKDVETAKTHFTAGMETCQKCHDKFQD